MKITDSTLQQAKKMENRGTRTEKYNVFLGGSCGGRKSPTTWRNDVAIPLLTAADITFFNPQVDTWTHDLIYKEKKAKENSDWLLFMLESSTRGIVSLVEVAYLAGGGRSLILVLQEERENGKLSIKEDTVSSLEVGDIVDSQQMLSSIISRHHHCQYFSALEEGIDHVIDGLKQTTTTVVQHTEGNSYSTREEKRLFDAIIQKFCTMFKSPHKHTEESGRKRRPTDLAISPIQRYTLGIISAENSYNLVQQATQKLSSLRYNKDSVYVAQGTSSSEMDTLMRCTVILVVIPSTALACSSMCKAAYLLSKHKNIVMCVQDITSSSVDNGNTILTSSAVDDFNRARAYLRDMSNTHKFPTYTCIDDAMNHTSTLLGSKRRKTSLFTPIAPIAEVC